MGGRRNGFPHHPVVVPSRLGPHRRAASIHGASLLLAFLAISYLHVVIGEVVPKNLAIATADRLAVTVAPALLIFYRDLHRLRGGDREIQRRHYQYAARRRPSPVRRPFGGRIEADRHLQPRPRLPARDRRKT